MTSRVPKGRPKGPAPVAPVADLDDRRPKWARTLEIAHKKALQLLSHEDPRVSGGMAQSLLNIAARTGVLDFKGEAEDRVVVEVVVDPELARKAAQGDPEASAELQEKIDEAKRGLG